MIELTNEFKEIYPGASIGVLIISNINNQKKNSDLHEKKVQIEKQIRDKFEGYNRKDLKNIQNIKVYNDYYKKFKKTYHVLMQLESIAFKGRSIPEVDCLVESMFMAEVKNQLLTAGHDMSKLKFPIKVDISKEQEYVQMGGKKQICAKNDMLMYDAKGVISSVIYGPDDRTKIDMNTKSALYVVYAPNGISKESVMKHLEDIRNNIAIVSKNLKVEQLTVL